MNLNRFLVKVDRFSGWALFLLVIFFIVSGYGQTKQIIDPVTAKFLHDKLLPIPFFVFFIFHVGFHIRLVFRRWQVFKNEKSGNIYVFIFSLVILVYFLWLFFLK